MTFVLMKLARAKVHIDAIRPHVVHLQLIQFVVPATRVRVYLAAGHPPSRLRAATTFASALTIAHERAQEFDRHAPLFFLLPQFFPLVPRHYLLSRIWTLPIAVCEERARGKLTCSVLPRLSVTHTAHSSLAKSADSRSFVRCT